MKEIEDLLIIQKDMLEITKEHRKFYEEVINVKTARIMDKLKTEEGKQQLAKITQEKYKNMIEIDAMILQLEKALKMSVILYGMEK